MKKVLGIISRQSYFQDCDDLLLDTALREVEKEGIITQKINLADYNILNCQECYNCEKLLPCPLLKEEDDQTLDILQKIAEADALIVFLNIHKGKPPELFIRLLNRIASKEKWYDLFYSNVLPVTRGVVFNKRIGIIYTGEKLGIGTQVMALYNYIERLKANITVSVGISLQEEQEVKFDCKCPNKYNSTIKMCQAVGEKIAASVIYKDKYCCNKSCSFEEKLDVQRHDNIITDKFNDYMEEKIDNIEFCCVYDISGNKIQLKSLLDNKTSVFVIGGPSAIDQNLVWVNSLHEKFGQKVNIYPVAEIDGNQIPVPKEFIVDRIKEKIVDRSVFVDWDVCFHNEMGIDYVKNYSTVLVVSGKGIINCKMEQKFSINNLNRVSKVIEKVLERNTSANTNINYSETNKAFINGLNICYSKSGKGQPLLIIHGNRDRKEYFSNIIKAFEKYYEVYAIDLRGHGDSDKPESGYSLRAFQEDIRQFVKKANFDTFNIIGHSLGATLAMKTALDNPMVDKLILLGTSANFHPSFRPENIRSSSINNTNLDKEAVKEAIQNSIAPYFFIDRYPQVKKTVMQHWREIPSYLHRALVMELKHPDMQDEISNIRSKTLVIAGQKDMITTFDQCKFVADNIKDSVFKVVKGTGHYMYLERPDEVISIIKTFLNPK